MATTTNEYGSEWIGNIYYVTERIYNQPCKKYNVMCDF